MDLQETNDEDVIPFCNNLLMPLSQKRTVCTLCDNCTSSFGKNNMLNIATELNGPSEHIILQVMSQVIDKNGNICLHNSRHTESHVRLSAW